MFFAKEVQMRSPGTLLGPQFVFMLTSSNTLYVVKSNEYVAYFGGSGLVSQTGRTMQGLFGPTS
jgi:hypothetical protein